MVFDFREVLKQKSVEKVNAIQSSASEIDGLIAQQSIVLSAITYKAITDLNMNVVPTLGNGTTYYFSTSGSDSNDGLTEANPKKTLYEASVNINAQAGDNILLKRGDVWRNERIQYYSTVPISGTSADRITFSSYGDTTLAKPKIDGKTVYGGTWIADVDTNVYKTTKSYDARYWLNGIEVVRARTKSELSEAQPFYSDFTYVYMYSLTDPATHTIELNGLSGVYTSGSNDYITYMNIDFEASGQHSATLFGSSYNKFYNCSLGKNSTGGLRMTRTPAGVNSTNNTVMMCDIDSGFTLNTDFVDNAVNSNSDFGVRDGLFIHDGADNNTVVNCHIKNWGHASVNMNETSGNSVRNNKILNNFMEAPDVGYGGRLSVSGNNCQENLVKNNILRNIAVRSQFQGINNKLINNVIDTVTNPHIKSPYEVGQGMDIEGYNGNSIGVVIERNLFMNTASYGMWITQGTETFRDVTVRGNIFYNCGDDSTAIRLEEDGDIIGVAFINNLFFDDRGTGPKMLDIGTGYSSAIEHINTLGSNSGNKVIDVGILGNYESMYPYISKYYGYERSV